MFSKVLLAACNNPPPTTHIPVYEGTDRADLEEAIKHCGTLVPDDMRCLYFENREQAVEILEVIEKEWATYEAECKPHEVECYHMVKRCIHNFLQYYSQETEKDLLPIDVAESAKFIKLAAILYGHEETPEHKELNMQSFVSHYAKIIAVLQYKKETGKYPVNPQFTVIKNAKPPYPLPHTLLQKAAAPEAAPIEEATVDPDPVLVEAKVVAVLAPKRGGTEALDLEEFQQRRVRMRSAVEPTTDAARDDGCKTESDDEK